jgi:hypothetical protein
VLGEMVELAALADRALALQEAGHTTSVFRAFAAGASDRNLCIASEPAARGSTLSSEAAAVVDAM